MNIRNLEIKDFSYQLPEAQIAYYPLAERDASRLLIYRDGGITEDIYKSIGQHLPEGTLLVFNNTRVVEARIIFQKPSGGNIEIFCLEPHPQYGDITQAMLQKGKVLWNCLVGGASKWKHGMVLNKTINTETGDFHLNASIIARESDYFTISFDWEPASASFAEVLHLAGLIPLPPYIKRVAEADDKNRYQTIYAQHEGSVAAPTAGLHFTEAVFNTLPEKNIRPAFVTLHVGAGTFKPVKAEKMQDHAMHTEFIDVTRATIEQLLQAEGNIFSVGTTSLRTLESIYWMGVKLLEQPGLTAAQLSITQWEVYDSLPQQVSVTDALQAVLNWMETRQIARLISQTQLLIAPGYRIRTVKGLVTNFHQPQSTLLLLVAALIGPDWKKVYAYALEKGFRFLSYGDGCLLFTDATETPM